MIQTMPTDNRIDPRDLDPCDEEAFFMARLKQAKAGLESATDEGAARHCRYLISRYEAVLKLYRDEARRPAGSKPH